MKTLRNLLFASAALLLPDLVAASNGHPQSPNIKILAAIAIAVIVIIGLLIKKLKKR